MSQKNENECIEINHLKIINKNGKENEYNELYNKDILEEINLNINSDLSRYKTKKIFGIKFYYIGNIYAFGFIKNSSYPLFCIDNMWYYHSIIYFIEIIIYYLGNYYIYSKIEEWKQMTFNLLLITFFIFYSLLILLNPGIIIKNKKGYKNNGYCDKCNIYYIPDENITHCPLCDVCVKKLDHHCHVVRKCITKNNLIIFILMVTNFILIYIFSLINVILYFIDYYKKRIRK